jgi:plasmid maintenance system antidote protein VapI
MSALPTPIHYSDAQVLTVRRLTQENWSDAAIAAYLDFPYEGHTRLCRDAFTPSEVAHMRALARSGWTHSQIGAYMEEGEKRVANAISGRSYGYLPNAVKKNTRTFKKYQVVFMRYLWREENWSQAALAAYFEAPGTVISAIVSGRSYKDIHGAVKKPQGSVPEKDVIRMRKLYARSKDMHQSEVAKQFGISKSLANAILTGRLYAHLPFAIKKGHPGRVFTDEQVLFIRLQYQAGLSLKKLGEAYGGRDPATINRIVSGETYAHVPEATPLRASGFQRRLTEEQVIQARRMYKTRWVPGKVIAKELGVGDSIYNVLRGRAYKELPDHVPAHVTSIRRGINTREGRPKIVRKRQAGSSCSSEDLAAMLVAD